MNNYYSLTLMNKYINYIHKLFILIKNVITKYSNKIEKLYLNANFFTIFTLT